MVDFEPPSGWNLPPGCFDFGICGLEFEDAFDEADHEVKTTPWKAALWARDWIVEHYKDEQEDVCDRWDG